MGGANQATVSAPATTSKVPSRIRVSASSIRFHEESQSLGEVHFHDDAAKLKCSVKSPVFFDAYSKWRDGGIGSTLNVVGTDGNKGGSSSVHFYVFPDDDGKLQVVISVKKKKKTEMGQTVLDLDKLSGYSC